MKLEVRTQNYLSLENLKQETELFSLPILILGEDFKIIAKGNSFFDSKSLRIGARFDNLLGNADRERLYLLEYGDMLVADLSDGTSKGYATVIRGIDCFLVCFRFLADGMVERILDRMDRLSGYDIGVNAYISAVLSNVDGTQTGKRLSTVIDRLLIELSDVHRLAFFAFGETASAFFSVLGEIAPALLRRVNVPKSFPESVALGCGDDFLLISAYVLSLCLDCSCGGGVDFSASNCEGGIRFSFSCDMADKGGDALVFANALCGRTSFENPLDRPSFWAFFARLIADTNLWEISASASDRFSFSAYIPSVARGDEFSVRDPETASLVAVLKFFFDR